MPLFDAWKRIAFDKKEEPVKHVWDDYLAREKAVYVNILNDKTTKIEGVVSELAEKFRLTPIQMCAFFDGISKCVDGLPPIDEIEETTEINFEIEFDRLYKQMVEYKAEPLYKLKEWDNVFTPAEQKELYTQQKNMHTVVRNESKIGRNDPCPCGSGKKHKKCCQT